MNKFIENHKLLYCMLIGIVIILGIFLTFTIPVLLSMKTNVLVGLLFAMIELGILLGVIMYDDGVF